MRTEQEIFDDLAALCLSKGYIHALAAICFRDNIIGFKDELKPENMEPLFSHSRLIRTEVTTLIGLMMRGPIDFSLPPQETISEYGARSDALLEELHQAIFTVRPDLFSLDKLQEPDFNPFKYGDVLREAIFYGGESAYTFQYRDLAPAKYGADADWLKRNKGIELDVAQEVCRDVATLLNARLMQTLTSLRDKPPAEWTMLDGFTFSSEEIAARIGRPIEAVRVVVEAFAAPQAERNVTFKSLYDFNSAYAYPFIRRGPDEFVLLQQYGIAEALYETPFYWMRRQGVLRHGSEASGRFHRVVRGGAADARVRRRSRLPKRRNLQAERAGPRRDRCTRALRQPGHRSTGKIEKADATSAEGQRSSVAGRFQGRGSRCRRSGDSVCRGPRRSVGHVTVPEWRDGAARRTASNCVPGDNRRRSLPGARIPGSAVSCRKDE
jgi:hypothetical protein